MATARQIGSLRRSWLYGDDEVEELTQRLFEEKVDTYVETLTELADAHGYDAPGDIDLSDQILSALANKADTSARQIVATHNREVEAFIDRNRARPPADLIDLLEDWAADRNAWKADQIATTEVYDAHADATAVFYRDAGLAPVFDFGGHGDDEPVCNICRALVETSPHPLQRVIEIGVPHVACRQEYHARVNDADLPDEIDLGQGAPAGIVSAPSLIERAGGPAEAVEMLGA